MIADQLAVTAGTLNNVQRGLAALGQSKLAGGRNTALRRSVRDPRRPAQGERGPALQRGNEHDGYSVTVMGYHGLWTNATDIPLRAIDEGLVLNRFGTLDPTDMGRAWRASLSVDDRATLGNGQLTSSAFLIDSLLYLYSNFTHYL
jgi:hypothetical protein